MSDEENTAPRVKKPTLDELAHPEYWEKRYLSPDDEDFDWFKNYTQLKPFLDKHIPSKSSSIINLGCGNSLLAPQMYDEGYTSLTNIDFSETVIKQMKERYPEQQWITADVRHTGFEQHCFDIALDKGTLDAMLSGSLWDPPDHVKQRTKAYIDEIARILKPTGIFLYITYRQPHFIKPMVSRPDIWDLEVQSLQDQDGAFEYFGYVMKVKH